MKPDMREIIARSIHESYRTARVTSTNNDDVTMLDWEKLPAYLKESNREQADDIFGKLRRIGCTVHKASRRRVALLTFTKEEIEIMAEMEHTRWIAERLRKGWKLGKKKDVDKRISPYLVAWSELPENVKELDRQSVRKIPELLAGVGLVVRRVK